MRDAPWVKTRIRSWTEELEKGTAYYDYSATRVELHIGPAIVQSTPLIFITEVLREKMSLPSLVSVLGMDTSNYLTDCVTDD